MKKEKEKEKNQNKMCKHCGGPLRHDIGDVSCLMCSRSENHVCDKCLFADKNTATQAKKHYKAA